MLQIVTTLLYVGAAMFAGAVLVAALGDARADVKRALFGEHHLPMRARVVARRQRVRAIRLRPAPLQARMRAAA